MASHLNFSAAASKLVSALVILAWVITILLWIVAVFGIAVQWLNWGVSLDCIRGDSEYRCPTAFEAAKLTVVVLAGLGVLTLMVRFIGRSGQGRR
jgi:hypothetical protein